VVSAAAPRSACRGNVAAHRKIPVNSELVLHVRLETVAKVLQGVLERTPVLFDRLEHTHTTPRSAFSSSKAQLSARPFCLAASSTTPRSAFRSFEANRSASPALVEQHRGPRGG